MPTVVLSPIGGAGEQFFNNNGTVLSGGKIYTYAAGTTTPLTTYTSLAGTVANPNPVVLNSAGRVSGQIWLIYGASYKFVIKDSLGNTIDTQDNISGSSAAGGLVTAATIVALKAMTGMTTGTRVLVQDIGFFRYDSTSSTTAVGSLVVTPDAGVGRWFLEVDGEEWRPYFNVKQYGALGDDSADDTAEIQAAITAAPTGSTIVFPSGIYRVSSQITWSGKVLHLRGMAGASIREATAIQGDDTAGGMLYLNGSGCSGSSVIDLTFLGIETQGGFSGASTKDYSAIAVSTADSVIIERCTFNNKTYGAYLTNCTNAKVIDCSVDGFLATDGATGDNYNAGVYVNGGSKILIHGLTAKDVGQGVLVGGDANRVIVSDSHFNNCQDNGVYYSSVTDSLIIGCTAQTIATSGFKARGSRNTIRACSVKTATVGISVTGDASTLDAYGYNGHGNSVEGNTIDTTTGSGIAFGIQDTYYSGRNTIANNVILNSVTGADTNGAISVIGGAFFTITGNEITNCDGTVAAIVVTGLVGGNMKDSIIANNRVIDSASNGMRLTYGARCVVQGNTFKDCSTIGVEFRYCTDSIISENVASDGVTTGVSCGSTYTNTTNTVIDNVGTLSGDWEKNYRTTRARTQFTTAPTAGTWAKGDVVWNSSPDAGEVSFWLCTTAGTPGTWTPGGYVDLGGSATYDAPSIAAGGTTTTTVTVTGAALGDYAMVSFGVSLAGLIATAYVSASNTVTVVLYNPTAGAVDLASTTIRARVIRQ